MSSHDAPPHDTKTGTTAYLACVAWRFWLGELSDKGRRGQRNREEIGFARFAREFFVHTPPLRPARQNRHATQATAYSGKKIVLKEQYLQRMICTRVAQMATLTSLSKFKSCFLLVVKQMLNVSACTIVVARGRLLST